jgi:hypothetical protein
MELSLRALLLQLVQGLQAGAPQQQQQQQQKQEVRQV